MSRPSLQGLIAAVVLALAARAALAGEGKALDTFWSHPQIATMNLRSIAMLPAASFDLNLEAEKQLETAWSLASKSTGYRWYYSTLSKELLRRAYGGDSVIKAVRNDILKDGRVDSLAAQSLCTALRTSAVLTLRADQWERVQIEWNQTGKPWTRVTLHAALVDSSGRLLWTASGSETGEGPLHQADEATLGVKSSGLTLESVTGDIGPPNFAEVLERLFSRWTPKFPAPAAPAAGSGG
jgi:hypothetical protein